MTFHFFHCNLGCLTTVLSWTSSGSAALFVVLTVFGHPNNTVARKHLVG